MASVEIWPVLIAGGRGTRFWPLSRKNLPKQLLCLTSENPLIHEVCRVLAPLAEHKNIFVSTSTNLAPAIKKALPEIEHKNFITEPAGRDTAPAIGLALALLSRRLRDNRPEPAIAFLPSDHHIRKPGSFRKTLQRAARIAGSRDLIVTIGIQPDFPATGFGYIRTGRPLAGSKKAFMVRRFMEKPGQKQAVKHVRSGCLWNAGMFIVRPGVLWSAFRKYQPRMLPALEKIRDAPASKLKSVIAAEFPKLQKISFDYAVMEKAKEAAVVSGDFGWSDIGGYQVLRKLLAGKGVRNAGTGKLVALSAQDVFAHTKKLTALIGVRDLAVVETDDAILVMDLSSDAQLKQLVSELERLGLDKYL
jgi:mannose-1-phosphate guanylyltransferase